MKILALAFAFVAVVILAASCSFQPATSARIFIDGSLPRFRAAGRNAYDGYVVNVSGPGISPTVSSQGIGDYAPDCVEVGVSSKVLSYDTLSTEGVTLKLAAGPNRKIQIFGVTSSLGKEILNQPISFLFNKRVPQLFSLAKAEGVNLYRDQRLDLTASASDPKPLNVLRNCFSSDVPVELIPPENVSQMRILAISETVSPGVNSLKLNLETGALSFGENVDLITRVTSAKMSPDLTSALLFDSSSGSNETLAMSSDGTLDSQGGGSTVPFLSAAYAFFRGDSLRGFTARNGADLAFISLQNGRYSAGIPSSLSVSPDRQVLTYGNFLYRIRQNLATVIVESAEIPTNLSSGTFSFVQRFTVGSTSDTATNSVVNSRGIYVNYTQAYPVVQFLKHSDSSGGLSSLGGSVQVGTVMNVNKMVVSPDGKFLFVRVIDTANRIRCYKLNSDGSVPATEASSISADSLIDFTVEPTSRYFVTLSDIAGVPTVRSYSWDSEGNLSLLSTYNAGLTSSPRFVLAFPVR